MSKYDNRFYGVPWAGGQGNGFNQAHRGVVFDVSDLKAYYKFDEASGNIINKASAVGSSDMIANSDLVVAGATHGVTGIIDDAVEFDGVNDRAEASSSAVADWKFMNVNGAAFTINYWAKLDTFAGSQDIFSTTDFAGTRAGVGTRISGGGTIQFFLGKNGTDFTTITATSGFPDTTDFHMVTYHYDDATGNGSIIVDDGTPVTTGSHNLTNTDNPQDWLNIGNNPTGAEWFNGKIDELSVWDRVLTTDEITALYNGGSGLAL